MLVWDTENLLSLRTKLRVRRHLVVVRILSW
jgi:hypothetical protein